MASLVQALCASRNSASLAVFRVLFGALMATSAVRFMLNGWIERFFGERTFYFKYWGFSFIEPGPVWAMYGVYTLLAVLGACIAVGLFYRVAIVLFFVVFSYAELTDVTNYLNHYYLVSLLALLMSFMPLHARFSLDAVRKPALARATLPAWMLYVLRFQVAVVYLNAALAKLGSDWLVHGEPLNVWLAANVDAPLIGRYLLRPEVALFASWSGFLHDLLIVPLLLFRPTRAWAYAGLLFFHGLTSTWFNIGIFPVLMPLAATLFFAPDWPVRWGRRARRVLPALSLPSLPLGEGSSLPPLPLGEGRVRAPADRIAASAPELRASSLTQPSPRGRGGRDGRGRRDWLTTATVMALALYCLVQVMVPLRAHLYGGNVLWHEQGMRFSWRVMVRAKHGSVSYRVELADGREVRVPPHRYLTSEQEREMSGQPDLILQLAHQIARDLHAQGVAFRAIRVDALVSLNGRPAIAMIAPDVDLSRIDDGLALAPWITEAPDEPPVRLAPAHSYASVGP